MPCDTASGEISLSIFPGTPREAVWETLSGFVGKYVSIKMYESPFGSYSFMSGYLEKEGDDFSIETIGGKRSKVSREIASLEPHDPLGNPTGGQRYHHAEISTLPPEDEFFFIEAKRELADLEKAILTDALNMQLKILETILGPI